MKIIRRALYVVLTLSMMCEELLLGNDPVAQVGWYLQRDLKSWTPIPVAFNLIELALITLGIAAWMARPKARRRAKSDGDNALRGRITTPLLVLAGALVLSILWGMVRPSGGPGLTIPDTQNLTFALFEVRALGTMIFAYFLVGLVLRDEGDLGRLVWCVLIASTWLVLDDSLRSLFILKPSGIKDLAYSYDHVDAVVLVFGAILCASLLAFGGSRAQRRYSLVLLPGILVTLQLMERRASFAILAIGMVVLVVMLYRLRPKLFWRVVPATLVIASFYLAVFWNNGSTLGQPARAFRSLISPDPRDAASNDYRQVEHDNLVWNINGSPVMGLGFGRPYVFREPLANLSFWPFWHYEAHNAVLWLWMDGGLPTFFAFWWAMGAGMYWGGQELSKRRDDWMEGQADRVTGPRDDATASGSAQSRATATTPAGATARLKTTASDTARRVRGTGGPATTAVRTPSRRLVLRRLARAGLPRFSGTQGAALALLVAGVCQIVMQVAYSYVDLGLISGRDMLLVGVILGVRGGARAATSPVEVVGTAARRATAGPRRGTGAPTRGTGAPTQRMDVDPHAYPSRERDRAGPIYSRSGH
jgi:hypothetical protein